MQIKSCKELELRIRIAPKMFIYYAIFLNYVPFVKGSWRIFQVLSRLVHKLNETNPKVYQKCEKIKKYKKHFNKLTCFYVSSA